MALIPLARSKGPRRSARWWRDARDGYLFALPWLLGFCIFTLGPTLVSIMMSFTRWDGITPLTQLQWVGVENYRELVTNDARFVKALAPVRIRLATPRMI